MCDLIRRSQFAKSVVLNASLLSLSRLSSTLWSIGFPAHSGRKESARGGRGQARGSCSLPPRPRSLAGAEANVTGMPASKSGALTEQPAPVRRPLAGRAVRGQRPERLGARRVRQDHPDVARPVGRFRNRRRHELIEEQCNSHEAAAGGAGDVGGWEDVEGGGDAEAEGIARCDRCALGLRGEGKK